jgi:hypothetical protein
MKNKITSTVLFVLLITSVSHSQFLSGFGAKLGLTLANQKFDYTVNSVKYDSKPILGYNTSVFVEMLNTKLFSLVVDPGYEQRGHGVEMIKTDEFGNKTGTYDLYIRTDYITIGALGKIIYETKSVSPYLIIGPKLDLYLGYKTSYSQSEYGLGSPDELQSIPHEDTKDINYSINLGAGLQFEKLLPYIAMLEFNYSPAINSSYNSSFVVIKDSYFNMKLGINFIKKKTKSPKK